MDYRDLLKDGRWKKKSYQILHRDGYRCRICGRSLEHYQLNVHHTHYVPHKLPWEYSDKELVSLCSECHEWVHSNKLSLVLNKVTNSETSTLCLEGEFMEGIDKGTILATDDGEYIFSCNGRTFRKIDILEHPDTFEVERFLSDYVFSSICYIVSRGTIVYNDYVFPLSGLFAVKYHNASEDERKRFMEGVIKQSDYDYRSIHQRTV